MKNCFYFCIPHCNGEIDGNPFILTSLSKKFVNMELIIYRVVINGFDYYIQELGGGRKHD